MPLVVNTNIPSLIAQRNLTTNTVNLDNSLNKLSSGLRINKASDDAAGLTISETLRSQIRGFKTAMQNAQDGISILQVTEGTLSVINDNLQRIRELTIQAANDTNATAQRDAIEQEIKARLEDNDRIAQASQFNGIRLLTGSAVNARLHIGAGSDAYENTLDITSALASSYATALGILNGGAVVTDAGFGSIASINFSARLSGETGGDVARLFLDDVDRAIAAISARRSLIGAIQNRLDSAIQNIQLGVENFSASESRIRDLDVAAETAIMTKNQILQRASISVLAQANQTPGLVLNLLQ